MRPIAARAPGPPVNPASSRAMIGAMTVQSSPLAHAYHQRRGSFVSDERYGDWGMKLYGLARPETGVRPELLDRTRALAAETLPPVDERHHGAAFAIAHDARFPIALIYWWQDQNELHGSLLRGRGDRRPRAGRPDGDRLRVGAGHRRVRAPRVDRRRDRQPGRAGSRRLPQPAVRGSDLVGACSSPSWSRPLPRSRRPRRATRRSRRSPTCCGAPGPTRSAPSSAGCRAS